MTTATDRSDALAERLFEATLGALELYSIFLGAGASRTACPMDLEGGDGRPGDDDRIRRDIETVLGSQFDDALAGSPYTMRLAGNDGDDQITGGSGQELLSGGDGQEPHRRPRRRARRRRLRGPAARLGRGRPHRRGRHHRLRPGRVLSGR